MIRNTIFVKTGPRENISDLLGYTNTCAYQCYHMLLMQKFSEAHTGGLMADECWESECFGGTLCIACHHVTFCIVPQSEKMCACKESVMMFSKLRYALSTVQQSN